MSETARPNNQKPATAENLAAVLADHQAEAVDLPIPPFPITILPNSGLYTYSPFIVTPSPVVPIALTPLPTTESDTEGAATPVPAPAPSPLPIALISEELRLDVDGYYPQMKASGRIAGPSIAPLHWIANVQKIATNTYEGNIFYKEGNVGLLPQTHVKVVLTRTLFSPQSATATFTVGGPTRVRVCTYKSRYFHPVNFEFDVAQGVNATLSYQTSSHPNRPASLPAENLTIVNVYRRAGFDVTLSGGNSTVPIAAAGADAKWSDMEMHDAMQIHWSKFANAPQWALWTLFASLHEMGTSLGGVMFDDIGPNHRQGTSLFVDSFIKNPPPGDPAPAAFVQRMIFWTACHEMGHSFNLAHSWQKALGTPWIPLANEPLARSFMNYPYNVPGGTTAFFSDFMFRFSDQELIFMRHAPFRFVQQGNANWFDHHGFQEANVSPEPKLSLSIEPPRKSALFDFMEPVVLDLKLKNTSNEPQLIEDRILASPDHMTVILKKRGKPARQLVPFIQRCWQAKNVVLAPGAEVVDSLFASVGRNGWDLAEPGYYTIQAALHLNNEDVVSDPITIRVAPPRGYDEEFLAQDFFSDEVGRVLTFDGTGYMESANNTLYEVTERLPQHRAAIHAKVALAAPMASNYKKLAVKEGRTTVTVAKPDVEKARSLLSVLVDDRTRSVATLGEIDYNYYCDRFKELLKEKAMTAGQAR